MMDNKGRLFGKVSIIDLLIILLVVLAVGVSVFKFGFSAHKDVNNSSVKIEYVVKVEGVRDFTVNSMKEEQKIYDDESDACIGTIKKIEVEDSKDYALKSDGTTVYTSKPDRYDVYLTVESDARILNGGFFANGTKEIGAFSGFKVYSQTFSCDIEVQSVKQLS